MDKSFSLNNKSFGATWLRLSTPEQKEAEGISWETPVEPPVVRAPLEDEKANEIIAAKANAGQLLSSSDWQVLASVERSRLIPNEWAEFRAAVIAECERIEEAVSAADSYESLDSVEKSWPASPDDIELYSEPEEEGENNE
jgi:hypothetical protein